jgi:hypothetical protein
MPANCSRHPALGVPRPWHDPAPWRTEPVLGGAPGHSQVQYPTAFSLVGHTAASERWLWILLAIRSLPHTGLGSPPRGLGRSGSDAMNPMGTAGRPARSPSQKNIATPPSSRAQRSRSQGGTVSEPVGRGRCRGVPPVAPIGGRAAGIGKGWGVRLSQSEAELPGLVASEGQAEPLRPGAGNRAFPNPRRAPGLPSGPPPGPPATPALGLRPAPGAPAGKGPQRFAPAPHRFRRASAPTASRDGRGPAGPGPRAPANSAPAAAPR